MQQMAVWSDRAFSGVIRPCIIDIMSSFLLLTVIPRSRNSSSHGVKTPHMKFAPSRYLQSVPEMMVLAISQIIKALHRFSRKILAVFAPFVTPKVARITHRPVHTCQYDHSHVCSEQALDSSRVSRNLRGEEEMRSTDVAGTVCYEEDPHYGSPLGVASCVNAR